HLEEIFSGRSAALYFLPVGTGVLVLMNYATFFARGSGGIAKTTLERVSHFQWTRGRLLSLIAGLLGVATLLFIPPFHWGLGFLVFSLVFYHISLLDPERITVGEILASTVILVLTLSFCAG